MRIGVVTGFRNQESARVRSKILENIADKKNLWLQAKTTPIVEVKKISRY